MTTIRLSLSRIYRPFIRLRALPPAIIITIAVMFSVSIGIIAITSVYAEHAVLVLSYWAQIATAVAAVVYTIATAFMVSYIYEEVKQGAKSQKDQARGQEAQIFLDISRRYNTINIKRNHLMKADLNWPGLKTTHTSIEGIMASKEWK